MMGTGSGAVACAALAATTDRMRGGGVGRQQLRRRQRQQQQPGAGRRWRRRRRGNSVRPMANACVQGESACILNAHKSATTPTRERRLFVGPAGTWAWVRASAAGLQLRATTARRCCCRCRCTERKIASIGSNARAVRLRLRHIIFVSSGAPKPNSPAVGPPEAHPLRGDVGRVSTSPQCGFPILRWVVVARALFVVNF